MSPSDKNEDTTNSDSKEEREGQNQESVKPNGVDQSSPTSLLSLSSTSGMVTNIPSCTAKLTTLKCSENDQMKTFDPGEASNNVNQNIQSGQQLKLLVRSSNCVTKNNKNYKAGSKINKLADMLAKRSQNIVEMTRNVTSDVITDIMCASKVEGNSNLVDISYSDRAEGKVGSSVFCEKTVNNQPIESINESQNKFVPNENSENMKELQHELNKTCSDNSEIVSQETAVSEFNALKESLVKSETDGSTKTTDKFSENSKSVELSLILPEKKSFCMKLVNSEINKDYTDHHYQENKSNKKTAVDAKNTECSNINKVPKPLSKEKMSNQPVKTKSKRQKIPKCLVETSTQTSTSDFFSVEVSESELKSDIEPVLQSEMRHKRGKHAVIEDEAEDKTFLSDSPISTGKQTLEETEVKYFSRRCVRNSISEVIKDESKEQTKKTAEPVAGRNSFPQKRKRAAAKLSGKSTLRTAQSISAEEEDRIAAQTDGKLELFLTQTLEKNTEYISGECGNTIEPVLKSIPKYSGSTDQQVSEESGIKRFKTRESGSSKCSLTEISVNAEAIPNGDRKKKFAEKQNTKMASASIMSENSNKQSDILVSKDFEKTTESVDEQISGQILEKLLMEQTCKNSLEIKAAATSDSSATGHKKISRSRKNSGKCIKAENQISGKSNLSGSKQPSRKNMNSNETEQTSRKSSGSSFLQLLEKISKSANNESAEPEPVLCEQTNADVKRSSRRLSETGFLQIHEKATEPIYMRLFDKISEPPHMTHGKVRRCTPRSIYEKSTRSVEKKMSGKTSELEHKKPIEKAADCAATQTLHSELECNTILEPLTTRTGKYSISLKPVSRKSKSRSKPSSKKNKKSTGQEARKKMSMSSTSETPERVGKNNSRRMSELDPEYMEEANESLTINLCESLKKTYGKNVESDAKEDRDMPSTFSAKSGSERNKKSSSKKGSNKTSEPAATQHLENTLEADAKKKNESPATSVTMQMYEENLGELEKDISEKLLRSADKQICGKTSGSTSKKPEINEYSTGIQLSDDLWESVASPEASLAMANEEKSEDREVRILTKYIHACMYCSDSFSTRAECKEHEKSHSPKKNKQNNKCQFCKNKYPTPLDLKKHCIKSHPSRYAYCSKCDERFYDKSFLYSHNKLLHLTKEVDETGMLMKNKESLGNNPEDKSKEDFEEHLRIADKKTKLTFGKQDLNVDISFDSGKKSATSPRTVQKVSPRENKTEEQLLEMEMLFYSHLSENIRENLTNYLDGKLDTDGNPIQTDVINEPSDNSQTKIKSASLLSVVTASASGAPDPVSRAPSPYQTRSKTPNPLPRTAKKFKKLPNWQQKFWEKYNFPTNYRYEHKFWDKNYLNTEKSVLYLKDLSCLDIKTQLTLKENIKKLNNVKSSEERDKSSDKLTFPEYLSLVPKVNEVNVHKDDGNGNADIIDNRNQANKEQKSIKPLSTDLVKSRRKNSADNSTQKRQFDKNITRDSEGVKIMTRRQSIIELGKNTKKGEEDPSKRRKGSLDTTEISKMTLRRQTSLENLQRNPENNSKTEKISNCDPDPKANESESDDLSASLAGMAEISGEWVRPRIYLCGTCCAKFTNLWELEDHKWVNHPNVWCTHYEFEDEKIDKLFHRSEMDDDSASSDHATSSKFKLTDLYKRYLLPHGSLKTAKLVPNVSFPEECTKCKKNCMSLPELHKHMLDCGGDTTWFLTMYSSPMTIKRKWRPFGSRRRKQIGRRVVKRNIPNTGNIRSYHYQHRIRTKPGDVESIQKMLANLPEKRARRAIKFDEIKTRSQATIHSNRLLRKRFKVSFGTSIMRLKALKQQRQVRSVKKENSSKSTTDASTENTPTASPKRKNKQKESIQIPKEENVALESIPNNNIEEQRKKAAKHKKNKKDKKSLKSDKKSIETEKPLTRSNSTGNFEILKNCPVRDKKKSKQPIEKSESTYKMEPVDVTCIDAAEKKSKKDKSKSLKKKSAQKNSEKALKKDPVPVDENSTLPQTDKECVIKKKTKTEIEEEKLSDHTRDTEILEEGIELKKKKKEKLPEKTILRLKSNDKEKTELIKRIRKTLKNSKKILEKRVNKDKHGRRRSLRIQTLTDINIKEETASPETNLKEVREHTPDTKGSKLLLTIDSSSSPKKTLKTSKTQRGIDSKLSCDEDSPPTRRSSRNSEGRPEAFIPKTDLFFQKDALGGVKKMSDVFSDFEANRSEVAKTMVKLSIVDNSLNPTPETAGPLVGFEFESIRKSGRFSNPKATKDSSSDTQSNRSSRSTKSVESNGESRTSESKFDKKTSDLSEMPVLDKEEPVGGRVKRKSETEIPVLMPYEKDTIERNRTEQLGKRKGVVTFKVVNKRRRSSEKLNPLKIVKETSVAVKEKFEVESKSETCGVEKNYDAKMKKRKRPHVINEGTRNEPKIPKAPKVKKYFLGICPNEIDKGGDPKEDSGSDSEPLITFVNQKSREKTEPLPETSLLKMEIKENSPIPECKKEGSIIVTKEIVRSKKESKKRVALCLENQTLEESSSTELYDNPISENKMEEAVLQEVESEPKQQESLAVSTSQTQEQPLVRDTPGTDDYELNKEQTVSKSLKGLKMTVKLKEARLKLVDCRPLIANERNSEEQETENEVLLNDKKTYIPERPSTAVEDTEVTGGKMERRSRRVSKEIKVTNEFILDDPLILVDELWSDLDSDSDGSRKRTKKGKKKMTKKKFHEEKKQSSVNLEELLRNFGESKNCSIKPNSSPRKLSIKLKLNTGKSKFVTPEEKRRQLENRSRNGGKSYKRLSLRLFKFYKKTSNFGYLGQRLVNIKRGDGDKVDPTMDIKSQLSVLPFLAAEIKENPVQIIQCGVQKAKTVKKIRKPEIKSHSNMHLKISLPLQSINNLAVLNNNHLIEIADLENSQTNKTQKTPDEVDKLGDLPDENILTLKEDPAVKVETNESFIPREDDKDDMADAGDLKLKSRRSEVIDKIFYCEICKTYYYSSSQLKIHKLSNRHKVKESELSQTESQLLGIETEVTGDEKTFDMVKLDRQKCNEEVHKIIDSAPVGNVDADKLNEDTSEMPILEGPFIENPFVRLGMDAVEPPAKPSPPPSNMFGFTEDCLKDIQKAIGCTDEEMLILTLLGENSIEIENDILDLDSCRTVPSNASDHKVQNTEEVKERESTNGLFKMDFKKRITSALARLVNKAVLNLLQKYKSTHRTGISPEALSFLIKLSKVNNKKNILELDELLKNESEGETSNRIFSQEEDKKEHPFKFVCTICGACFDKESSKESHIIRSHRCKGMRDLEGVPSDQIITNEQKKSEEVMPYKYVCNFCGARFQKESTKECHIVRAHRAKASSKNTEEPSSSPVFTKEDEKREQNTPYKYLCTICGSRFQKESMWECHIKRSHKSRGKKNVEEVQVAQTTYEEDWSNTWTYDINDELPGSVETPQFLCSDCGINFTSPQEVLEHQKVEHSGQKGPEVNESEPLQSSTIGSSDEIIKGRKIPRRGPKHLTKAELDQQRILANNELRKLDRKFTNKNKTSKVKWGMDALKFTVEKENKVIPDPVDREAEVEESAKSPQADPKNIDIVPKLNLSRTSNIPEFKVVQKTTCLNRFQRILDNRMRRKSTRNDSKEMDEKQTVEKTFVEPVSVVRKDRKRKPNKCNSKKDDDRKVFDIYDFNDSESEPEPMAFSHIKRIGLAQSPTKLKLIKIKDPAETEKNKADSTTKDFETEDYDSEDSLPLSVVKRTKAEEEDEDIRGDDQAEKSDGILEQVEYLIEQLENQTNHPTSKEDSEKDADKGCNMKEEAKLSNQKEEESKHKLDSEYEAEDESVDAQPETFRVSLENKFLQLENIAVKKKSQELEENPYESQDSFTSESIDKAEDVIPVKLEDVLPVADSSQGVSDEEDSLPLVLMSKKTDASEYEGDLQQKSDNFSVVLKDTSFPVQENDFEIPGDEDEEEKTLSEKDVESSKISVESPLSFFRNEIEERNEKSEKPFETVNGNVIYRRNDSMSGFDTDLSDYEQFESNIEKESPSHEIGKNLIKEVMEKEDVVIVCSKKEPDLSKTGKKKTREPVRKRKQNIDTIQRKKKILPLLSATLEEENFRKSESPKLNKDAIMKKIWSRRRPQDDLPDENSLNSFTSRDNDFSTENTLNEDSHSEIDKEIIMKKIWNKKRLEHESEIGEVQVMKMGDKQEDIIINQTEISDEVVIKCGPKARVAPKRRKSRSVAKESSKEKIMRKIWRGRCTFQTKAALKTYETDHIRKENETLSEQHNKKRSRSSNSANSKKTKVLSDGERSDEDDLDSLLEEIEREEVEKAIRLEFLQLRRSDKANVEVVKESGNLTIGLFAETSHKQSRELADRKRKKIRKNVKHPRKGLLKRRKFMKKPIMKLQQPPPPQPEDHAEERLTPAEDRLKPEVESLDVVLGGNIRPFDLESKIKSRKHKKHRHKHHHHKHKHKKSKHRKYIIGKHKLKHKSMEGNKDKSDTFENFSILEKMCQEIPSQIDKPSQKGFNPDLATLDTKLDEILMSTSSSFEGKAKECDDVFYESRRVEVDRNYGVEDGNIYDFVDDDSTFLCESKSRHEN